MRNILFVVLVSGLRVSVANGDTFHVLAGDSIQSAIDTAGSSDEIIVHPGIYYERIDFNGKTLVLRAAEGPDVTVLDGQATGTVVRCASGEGPDTVLEGFQIVGGATTNGGGMFISAARVTVNNCLFCGNQAQYGGAVFVHAGQPMFFQCTFEQNTATASGGAVYALGWPGAPAPTMVDCAFIGNSAGVAGGALRNWDAGTTLASCRFRENHARQMGAGVANGGASPARFEDCVFEWNRTDTLFANFDCFGGAMANYDTSHAILINCVFRSNRAIALYPRLSRGGAMANGGMARPVMINCTLAGNTANLGNAIANAGAAHPDLLNSILWDGGGEIVNEESGTATISYSDVQGFWPGAGNIDEDPQWSDLRPRWGSSCIDSGDPGYAPAGARDLDGYARVLHGRVDMGAYEFGIGDWDENGVVDAWDFISGAACIAGPDAGPYVPGCEALDFEYDTDVDMVDVAAFQRLLGS